MGSPHLLTINLEDQDMDRIIQLLKSLLKMYMLCNVSIFFSMIVFNRDGYAHRVPVLN